ncbi:MAG: peptidylprolyl isomerase [Flavobacteriaceae bacterium]|nr:peptidylprolyl isomerase [Flavobacteriaceae bacterium]
MKKSILFLFICFWFLNCEDTKKSNQTIEESTVEDSLKGTVTDTTKVTKKSSQDTLQPLVNLTNATLEEFLLAYGQENPERFVRLETTEGSIQLELYENTPLHRAHFIYLIKNGYLNTTVFHRVVTNFIIQGGNSDRMETARMRGKMGKYTLPAEIIHRHHRGALAAAKEYRENPDDRSAAFEFYIVQSPSGAYHLDKNYTVFGKVTSGMDVVDKIAKLETDEGDWPLYNVFIKAVLEK